MYVDRFGYIPQPGTIGWDEGKIQSIPELGETVKEIERYACIDGYLYPPLVHQRLTNVNGTSEAVPGTERPVLLHKLPTSHLLELRGVSDDQRTVREGLGGFVIHFSGLLFGHRCQFEGWWVDCRINIRDSSDRILVRLKDAEYCLAQAIKTWAGWPPRQQRVAINALFLYNRTRGYEWDWERFQAEYVVLDAVYALASECYGVKAKGHKERIRALCERFGLKQDDDRIERIVKLRNDLIHEALWAGRMPCTGKPGDEAYLVPSWLHRLSARLFLATFKIEADYVRSPWWTMGRPLFKPKKSPDTDRGR